MSTYPLWRRFRILKALTVATFSLFDVQAQTGASVPPARTFYTDVAGRRTGVNERWNVDAGGERHGAYMRFNQAGLVIENATYVHGSKTGPAVYYRNWVENFYNPLQKRPDTKFSGSYNNGVQVGTWLAYSDDTNEHIATEFYDANGALRRRTLFKKGQPVEIGEQDANGNLVQTTFLENGKARVVTAQQQQAQKTKASALAYQEQEEANAKEAVANAQKAEAEAKLKAMRDASEAYSKLLESFKNIQFEPDSYVLTGTSIDIVNKLAAYVNAQAQAPISTIFVSVHTKWFNDKLAAQKVYSPGAYKSEARTPKEIASEQKRLYMLTLNRAATIKTMLLDMLKDKTTNIVTYACGGSLVTDDVHTDVKAETPHRAGFIVTDENAFIPPHVNISLTKDLPIARSAAAALSQQFKMTSN